MFLKIGHKLFLQLGLQNVNNPRTTTTGIHMSACDCDYSRPSAAGDLQMYLKQE